MKQLLLSLVILVYFVYSEDYDTKTKFFITPNIEIGMNFPITDVYKTTYNNLITGNIGFNINHKESGFLFMPGLAYSYSSGTPQTQNIGLEHQYKSNINIFDLYINIGYRLQKSKFIFVPYIGIGGCDINENIYYNDILETEKTIWTTEVNTGLILGYKISPKYNILISNKISYFVIDKYTSNLHNLLYNMSIGIAI